MIVVKANIIPVRVKRLNELIKDLELLLKPRIDSENAQSTVNVVLENEEVRRIWSELVTNLRRMVQTVVEAVQHVEGVDDSELLNTIADLIAYSLRWPLYGYGARHTNILAPHIGFIAYKLLRLVCKDHIDKMDKLVLYEQVYEWIVKTRYGETIDIAKLCGKADQQIVHALSSMARVLSLLAGISPEGERYQKLLELSLYTVPADTRPGLNTSSLLLHLVLTSAIAATLAGTQLDARTRGILRLATLLHDIGKPIDYENHVDESRRAAEYVLEPLRKLSKSLADAVNVVLKLIETHHSVDRCISELEPHLSTHTRTVCSALVDGDRRAAGIDRILELLENSYECSERSEKTKLCQAVARFNLIELAKHLATELSKIFGVAPREALAKAYRGSGRELWRKWRELWDRNEDLLLRISASMAKAISSLNPYVLGLEAETRGSERSSAILLVVDIGGIQASLRETMKLRVFAGLSLALDYLTYVAVPMAIERAFGATIESIVFAGGGSIHAIIPAVEDVDSRIEAIKRYAFEGLLGILLPGIIIRSGAAPINFDAPFGYVRALSKAFREIERKRAELGTPIDTKISFLKLAKPCSYCYSRPAHVKYNNEYLCLVCLARYLAFSMLGYHHRLRMLRSEIERIGGSEALERLQKILEDPLRALAYPYRDAIAIVKADGNAMALFMSSSLSPSAFFEKSVRIDLALRRGISTIVEATIQALTSGRVNDRALIAGLAATTLSLLYAGGDDMLAILPAGLALPYAMLLSYIVGAETGFRASISVGIAAGPRHQPIWWLLETADYLLSEAKKLVRDRAIEASLNASYVEEIAAIGYDYSARALSMVRSSSKLRERINPLTLARSSLDTNLLEIASSLLGEELDPNMFVLPKTVDHDAQLEEFLKLVVRLCLLESRASESIEKLNRVVAQCASLQILPFVLATQQQSIPVYKLVIQKSVKGVSMLSKILYELYIASRLLGG